MANPLRTLPIVENWDCHSCGACCRGPTVMLDKRDLKQLNDQKWHEHADFRDQPITKRETLLGGRKVLAQKSDGRCIFLTDKDRCRIHEEFGEVAKPSVCRVFPFRLVPLQKQTNLTLRFACPSAVRAQGNSLQQKLKRLRKSDLVGRFAAEGRKAPRISRKGKRDWQDFLHVAEVLRQITVDEKLPLVRKLVHGLRFCSLIDACDLSKSPDETHELVEILNVTAAADVGDFFIERTAPTKATGLLFRQSAVHYIRSHPTFPISFSFRDRLRLMFQSTQLAWGGRKLPAIHPKFEATLFSQLDRPLGALAPELLAPINRYFESNVTSLQYAVGNHNQSLVESFRVLALGFPMALWLLRMCVGDGGPTENDVVDIVSTLDRAQGASAIAKTAGLLGNSGRLEELVAWYAR